MSIQAGWNSALYQFGLIGKLSDTEKKVERLDPKVQEEERQRNLAETSRNRSRQANNPDFVGPLTADQARQRQGTILHNRATQARQWEKGDFVGPLTAHQQSRLDTNFFGRQQGFTTVGSRNAAQRAQEAAQEADATPPNTMRGAMDAVRASRDEFPDEEIVNPVRLGIGGGN